MASNPPIDGPSTSSISSPQPPALPNNPSTLTPPSTTSQTETPTLTNPDPQTTTLSTSTCHASITHLPLSATHMLDLVRSPHSGANVLFSGTTRSTFGDSTVESLRYSAYTPLALRSMLRICTDIQTKYSASGVAMVHRLGEVGVGEESILIAISTKHRGEAWRGGEEALERCKSEVEVWKMERFEGGGVWRANRDGAAGVKVEEGDFVPDGEQGKEGKVGKVITRSDPLPSEEDTKRPVPPLERGHGPVVHHQ